MIGGVGGQRGEGEWVGTERAIGSGFGATFMIVGC